jgi:serine/threonine protein kinase
MEPREFGRYLLLERIGTGGMADVFRALAREDGGIERVVAVKRLHVQLACDPGFLSMFLDEASIAARLQHPGVARILDMGRVDDDYYIALEHVHGRDLKAIFARLRERAESVPPALACAIVRDMLRALDHAHELRDDAGYSMQFVHRDISLQNVILSFAGDVKLIDFGVAKATGRSTHTVAGLVKGKFAYMSPEQLRGLPVDRRSDVFSSGVLLWEMLTGRRLFLRRNTIEMLQRVRDAQVVPPSEVTDGIPPELEAIVMRALAKHADDRYQSAAEFADALDAFCHATGAVTTRRDLGMWVRALFGVEYAEERARLAALQLGELPAPRHFAIGTDPGARLQALEHEVDESQVCAEYDSQEYDAFECAPDSQSIDIAFDDDAQASFDSPTMVIPLTAFQPPPALPLVPREATWIGWAPFPQRRRV